MFGVNLPLHTTLAGHARLLPFSSPAIRVRVWECVWLVCMGIVAAIAATYFDLNLRIPGHAILRVVFPMSVGLAVVPRRGAGLLMGGAAASFVGVAALAGLSTPGTGAMTSLLLFGPVIDLALWRARTGWFIYAGFGATGLLANFAAFAVRAATRGVGGNTNWWTTAPFTYVICGLLAGVICAAIWFNVQQRRSSKFAEQAK